ncbi:MAG TPA: hypothetical protein VFV23_10680 [Verrucomicrobiae bacterium]|nr:hypothetical protein [Verrucomicrobiae bacterium]
MKWFHQATKISLPQKKLPQERRIAVAHIGGDNVELFTRPSDEELLAAIERLAEQSPLRAIELSLAEKDLRLRTRLLDAAFQCWGKIDTSAAVDWIFTQPEDDFDRNAAVASLFKALAENPQAIARLIQQINEKYPLQADICGAALMDTLAEIKNSSCVPLLTAAYGCWANYQPQDAAASALQISDEAARTAALNAIINAWNSIDPQGLAKFAENNLPSGNQKTLAMSQSLIFWASQNPEAVANWINSVSPTPDFDAGEAAIATQPQVMQQPAVAINWAETINDPNLRSRTIAAVIETWQLSDPAAAWNFASQSPDLLPEDFHRLFGDPGH